MTTRKGTRPTSDAEVAAMSKQVQLALSRIRLAISLSEVAVESEPEEAAQTVLSTLNRYAPSLSKIARRMSA